jgi:NAD(P)-dependent dehydrogenase (short-subunit alcohol dehydrogenase family)
MINNIQTYKDYLNNKNKKNKKKFAIITGGTGRIGSVFVNELLHQNYEVLILSRSKNKFTQQIKLFPNNLKKKIHWSFFDLLDEKSLESTLDYIYKKSKKKIDCLINCASNSKRGEFNKYTLSSASLELKGVFESSFLLTEKVLPLIRKSGAGKIINVGSLWGAVAPNYKTYLKLNIGPSSITSSGKSAFMHYTKVLASREARFGITSNNLVPGWFPRKGKVENKMYIKNICDQIPMKRIGQLKDLNGAIKFLISEESRYFNGQDLIVDGGFTIL